MEIYNSKYLRLEFFAKDSLMEITWKPTTEEMSEVEYKEEFLNFLKLFLDHRPKKIIPDHRTLLFPINPDLQEWTNKTIFPTNSEVITKYNAVLISPDLIIQLATEQLMEEENGLKFITKFFSSKEEARTWILSKEV